MTATIFPNLATVQTVPTYFELCFRGPPVLLNCWKCNVLNKITSNKPTDHQTSKAVQESKKTLSHQCDLGQKKSLQNSGDKINQGVQ